MMHLSMPAGLQGTAYLILSKSSDPGRPVSGRAKKFTQILVHVDGPAV